jgi:hypothetical protein
MWNIYTKKYYLFIKNEIPPFAAKWMFLIFSEKRQIQKDNYYMFSHIYGSFKIKSPGQAW